jgi:hypothetical protein
MYFYYFPKLILQSNDNLFFILSSFVNALWNFFRNFTIKTSNP